ncbi:MAG TPA: UDP-N-acetylglucosamine 2-epimerase (non-hydrolyzing) [Tepidisphaeraceae bacterium]|nr:UDP-N-acetylglucosamine 2-epimerase (non-hydrolyzing) [Tepidisphaeraceae bacterium]
MARCRLKVLNVVGARPNFIKIAPIMRASRAPGSGIEPMLVHTGQHYDSQMSQRFFQELEIPRPDVDLGVGAVAAGSSHAQQTAAIMNAFEPVVLRCRPDVVLVVGDVNSTLACALVAAKLRVKLAHVEAGLRSFDRSMPEEINRIVTDSISDLLFCSERSGVINLKREGMPADRIHFVGNVMIDTLISSRDKAGKSTILEDLKLQPGEYALLTLHRPGNVDEAGTFGRILDALEQIQRRLAVVFPVHPRTRAMLARSRVAARLGRLKQLRLIEPAGYLDFVKLMSHARVVLTDSGGIQEETTVLGVPCLTLRDNTERPVTIRCGTNQLVGTDPARILSAFAAVTSAKPRPARLPPLWDGRAAQRIVEILAQQA